MIPLYVPNWFQQRFLIQGCIHRKLLSRTQQSRRSHQQKIQLQRMVGPRKQLRLRHQRHGQKSQLWQYLHSAKWEIETNIIEKEWEKDYKQCTPTLRYSWVGVKRKPENAARWDTRATAGIAFLEMETANENILETIKGCENNVWA